MAAQTTKGSSPRVRGKREIDSVDKVHDRLIPACAGKTLHRQQPGPSRWAHPRVCGENRAACTISTRVFGSSPRVRGKRTLLRWKSSAPRLIPACAGKTRARVSLRRRFRAHPRVCGENRPRGSVRSGLRGSSPRVRGKRLSAVYRSISIRLIPACAGKTMVYALSRPSGKAHPRVCGENVTGAVMSCQAEGSSPRVRGKH